MTTKKKKIVFLTGTRADFGKMKSLMQITEKSGQFEVYIFATGMHMNPKYGRTVHEIKKCGFKRIFSYYNHGDSDSMDIILARTIEGFSAYVKDIEPDMIVIHGDRVEAMAGVLVGGFNNILTTHIEGGDVSGTIDESIRHSISKMANIHLVSGKSQMGRLVNMGEPMSNIHIIGSPSLDIIHSKKLPSIQTVKKHYDIGFKKYAILIFHPVTTELNNLHQHAKNLVDSVIRTQDYVNYIIINSNNDAGNDIIMNEYNRLRGSRKVKIFPSIRFEYYVTLLKNADFIIGNSSSGIMEAKYCNTPAINIGTRQNGRSADYYSGVHNVEYSSDQIVHTINRVSYDKIQVIDQENIYKNSDKRFLRVLKSKQTWNTNLQKNFKRL